MTSYFGQSFACASSRTMCVCKMCVESGPFNRGEELVFAGLQEAEKAELGFNLPALESSIGLLGLPKRQKSRLKKVA